MHLLIFLLFISLSHAENEMEDWHSVPEYSSKHVCYKSLQLFCNYMPAPSKRNEYDCLHKKLNKLTSECKAFVLEQLSRRPCISDVQKLCIGEQQNAGKWIFCLLNQIPKLSKDCKKLVEATGKRMSELETVMVQHCKEELKGCDPSLTDKTTCMSKLNRENKLSLGCKKALETFR